MNKNEIRRSATDSSQIHARMNLARTTASTFQTVGEQLHVIGHIVGTDRRDGKSPFGHGDDATVAVSMLLRIGSQLISGSAELFDGGRHYAGSALVRQLVEVEYLAWAFETKDEDATRWLRSTRAERGKFFSPRKLREAAGKRFRGVDYGYHCELGGHPVPRSWMLLSDDIAIAQLMLSDCLGHAGRIWDHVVGWAKGQTHPSSPVLSKADEMLNQFREWKSVDLLVNLPPPPPDLAD
jgi:hypothetical protein